MRKNNQLMRAESIVKTDAVNLREDFLRLFTEDLMVTLNEYFDCQGLPKIEINKCGAQYLINVTTVATQIKMFNKLPNV